MKNDLSGYCAGSREGVGTLDCDAVDDGAVLEHVIEVDKLAVVDVTEEVVAVMEVDDTGAMCLDDFLREDDTLSQLAGDGTGERI